MASTIRATCHPQLSSYSARRATARSANRGSRCRSTTSAITPRSSAVSAGCSAGDRTDSPSGAVRRRQEPACLNSSARSSRSSSPGSACDSSGCDWYSSRHSFQARRASWLRATRTFHEESPNTRLRTRLPPGMRSGGTAHQASSSARQRDGSLRTRKSSRAASGLSSSASAAKLASATLSSAPEASVITRQAASATQAIAAHVSTRPVPGAGCSRRTLSKTSWGENSTVASNGLRARMSAASA
jgi:hypothetical protein